MQDIAAVASACWDWLYITVLGLLSFLLNTDHSTKNNRGSEKDNKWLQMDKRSIVSLHTGLWLLYHTDTVRGRSDWLSYSFILPSGKMCGQQFSLSHTFYAFLFHFLLFYYLDYAFHVSIFLSYNT